MSCRAALLMLSALTLPLWAQAQLAAEKAILEDHITRINEPESEAMFCVVAKVAGQRVENALSQTRDKSRGRGNRFYFYLTDRQLDPAPVQVTLRCEYAYARPLDALLGNTPSLEGAVDFQPEPGKAYEVRADFDGPEWAIWIRDAKSRLPVSPMVYGKPSK